MGPADPTILSVSQTFTQCRPYLQLQRTLHRLRKKTFRRPEITEIPWITPTSCLTITHRRVGTQETDILLILTWCRLKIGFLITSHHCTMQLIITSIPIQWDITIPALPLTECSIILRLIITNRMATGRRRRRRRIIRLILTITTHLIHWWDLQ